MKNLLVILLLISSNAFAQDNEHSKISVGIYHSIFDTVSTQGTLYSGQNAEGTEKTNTAFGVSVEYSLLRKSQLGFTSGLTYDGERSFSGGTLSSTNYSYEQKVTASFLTFYANVNFLFNDNIYAFAGPNLSSVIVKSLAGSQPEGKLGYQAGVGYMFDKNWSVELEYRVINNKSLASVSHKGSNITDRVDQMSLNSVLMKVNFSIGD